MHGFPLILKSFCWHQHLHHVIDSPAYSQSVIMARFKLLNSAVTDRRGVWCPENLAIFGFDKFDGALLSKMMRSAFRRRIYLLSNGFDQKCPFHVRCFLEGFRSTSGRNIERDSRTVDVKGIPGMHVVACIITAALLLPFEAKKPTKHRKS
jgi:hypothetical protein